MYFAFDQKKREKKDISNAQTSSDKDSYQRKVDDLKSNTIKKLINFRAFLPRDLKS